jgi:transposase
LIPLPSGTKIWLVAGITDMRNGFNGLAAKVQTTLKDDPMSGHVFIFRGRNGSQVKLLWSTGDGLCLLTKRLERGRFAWPSARDGKVFLTPAQLAMLLKVSTGGSLKTAYVTDYVVGLFILVDAE